MARNPIRTAWAEGRPILNGWLSIANAFTAEIVARQGYDALTIDIQHGILDYGDAVPMLQAMGGTGVVPMARVPWLDAGALMKALDAGALGVICPMVNTGEDAARLVSYCRYPPDGQRSFGPTRAVFAHGADYHATANEEVLVLAMIETAAGVENLDEIAATPGLDGLYIGPSDLSIGYTNGRLKPGMDREEDEMIAVIHRIRDAAHANGKMACLHCASATYAAKAVGWGFDLVTLTNDVRLLAAAAEENVTATRALIGK